VGIIARLAFKSVSVFIHRSISSSSISASLRSKTPPSGYPARALVGSRVTKIAQRVLPITHHDKLAGAALVGTTSRGESLKGLFETVRIVFKKQEQRRGRPTLYFEVCATRSGRRLPCLPTFRPDTAPKAVTDATHIDERYTEDLNRFLVVKALTHYNQFISIPRIKLYIVTVNREDGLSYVTPHVLAQSSVLCNRVLDCIGHAVL
jgi:hypothetical protein